MYDITYIKNYDGKKSIVARIRFLNKADAKNTIKYLKSCTKENPKPDTYNGGEFWVTNLKADGRTLKWET